MGMKEYEEAITLANTYKDILAILMPVSEQVVQQAEKNLNVQFTPIYLRFLSEYGYFRFSSFEFCVIAPQNKPLIPLQIDLVAYTLKLRNRYKASEDYLPVLTSGFTFYEYVYTITCQRMKKENIQLLLITSLILIAWQM